MNTNTNQDYGEIMDNKYHWDLMRQAKDIVEGRSTLVARRDHLTAVWNELQGLRAQIKNLAWDKEII